jgi:membrane-bound lytic murein transglycosylase D
MKKWAFITLLGTSSLCLSESQQAVGASTEEVLTIESLLSPKHEEQIDRYMLAYMESPMHQSAELKERMQRFFPMIEYKLSQAGLPLDLKYMTIVESRLEWEAQSHVGATGLWQLMVPTARYCGLTVDYWVDERLDPERATDAAIYYLQDLYNQFEDWGLVLAAYNAGPGRVRKAMRLSGASSFSDIIRYLPRETRQYIPRFLAAKSYIQEEIEVERVRQPLSPDEWWTTKIFLDQANSLSEIAERLGIERSLLRRLNPAWRYEHIGQGDHYFVRIPERLLPVWWQSSRTPKESQKQVDNASSRPDIPIYTYSPYQELFLPARRHQTLLDLGLDIGINPFRIAKWNAISVDAPLGKGESVRLILPADHDCLMHLIHLVSLEEDLNAVPPEEIRTLEYQLPPLEKMIRSVSPFYLSSGRTPMPDNQQIPLSPLAIDQSVFVQILRRKRHRSFPFSHEHSLREEWAYHFSKN